MNVVFDFLSGGGKDIKKKKKGYFNSHLTFSPSFVQKLFLSPHLYTVRLSALPKSSTTHTPSPSTVCLGSNGKAQVPLGSNKEQLILLTIVKRKKIAIQRIKNTSHSI